jgi:hypothetical protein
MEPPPLTGRSPKRRARRSSNQDVIPPSVTAACKTGDDAVVAQFLAVRSNLLQLDTHAEDTSTLLHVAAESGTTKVIELLLANGASHRSMWKRALPQVIARVPPLVVGGPPHPRRAEESRARLSLRGQRRLFSICFPLPTIRRSCLDEDGQTALHMATAAGHLDAVKGTLHITFMHMHYLLPTTHYLLLDSVKGLTRGECPELTVLDKYRMTPAGSVKGRPPLYYLCMGTCPPGTWAAAPQKFVRPTLRLLHCTTVCPFSLPGPSI